MKMSKKEFLLRVALKAIKWGEGADFEMSELIGQYGPLADALKHHYGVQYPKDEPESNWFPAYDEMSPEAQEFYAEAFTSEEDLHREKWQAALDQCQKDACAFLEQEILWESKQSETML